MLISLHALIWAWIGAIVMFTVTVSPTVFATLEGPQASAFLRAYFPRLFKYEILVGLAVVGISIGLSSGGKIYQYGINVGLVVTLLAYLNLRVIMPRVNQVADELADNPNPKIKKQFGLLHGLSVGLFVINAMSMIALFAFG